MKGKVIRRAAAALLSAIVLLTPLLPARVFAGTNIPVTVEINVTYIVDGNAEIAGGDSFTVTADDPLSPMPDGTEAGKKTIRISREGSVSFGDIRYEKPGIHWYTVKREMTEKKGVVKDGSVYKVKVIALNDGHGYVLAFKEGSDKKQELIYRDRVAPDTGDTGLMALYAALAVTAAAALTAYAAVRVIKRREVKNEAD